MQVCPDCHAQCGDDANYCGKCQAKLPNAKDWIVDYKKLRDSTETELKKTSEQVHISLNDEKFQCRLFRTILGRAREGSDSSSENERYLSKEILMMVFQEVMKDSEGRSEVVKD